MLLSLALAAGLALPQAGSAQEPSRLRIAIPADDGSLTPYTFVSGYPFMSLVYDTLMWRDKNGIPQPWLAKTVKRSPTGRFVTVRLRQGIRWHDGRRLTAADVAFTYAYMLNHPHPRFTPELQDIKAIHIRDRLTVDFELRRRSLGFDDQPLADVPILPAHLWATLPRGRRAPPGLPVGTGPYRLTKHEPGKSYRFDANRDYFRGAPSVSRIDVPVIRREDAMTAALRSGRVDAAPITVAPGSIPKPPPAVITSDEVSYNGTMLAFNVAGKPFDRLVARQAVARALDLKTIAGNAGGVAGGVVPANRGMLDPRSRWARAGLLHHFDPDAARLAFTEQGIGPFTVAAPRNDPVRLEVGKRVVRALTDVGARARLLELSPRALDRALGRRDRRASFDVAVVGIPALASYDPAFLTAAFGDPHTASLNDGGYRSEEFSKLADRVASAPTELARRGAVDDELRYLASDLPAVPLLFGGGTIQYRPGAYNRWVDVRGTGILDKRSFLRGAAPVAAAKPGAGEPADLLDPSADEGFSLVPVIIAFFAIMLVAGGWWLVRRRT